MAKSKMKKKWYSLREFSNWLKTNRPEEKIIQHRGFELLTNKHIYRLYEGELRIYEKTNSIA